MKKVLIAAHDSGGAEVVSAWVRANPQYEYHFLLQGPAVSIFSHKLDTCKNYSLEALPELILNVDFVLTATSWNSDLERIVIHMARAQGIFVISYLDHWTNYLERFFYQKIYCFPDEIWVGDSEAEHLAKNVFNNISIRLVPNQYFIDLQNEYKKIVVPIKTNLLNVLYLCEPVSAISLWKTGNENSRHYTEFSGLQFFFDCIQDLEISKYVNVVKLRLHPSEKKNKYDLFIQDVQKKKTCSIIVSYDTKLLEDLAWADWVIGISSMALVIAALLNKKVFTCVPTGAIVTKLPIGTMQQFNKFTVLEQFEQIECADAK